MIGTDANVKSVDKNEIRDMIGMVVNVADAVKKEMKCIIGKEIHA